MQRAAEKKKNWRRKHEDFINSIRSAKDYTEAETTGMLCRVKKKCTCDLITLTTFVLLGLFINAWDVYFIRLFSFQTFLCICYCMYAHSPGHTTQIIVFRVVYNFFPRVYIAMFWVCRMLCFPHVMLLQVRLSLHQGHHNSILTTSSVLTASEGLRSLLQRGTPPSARRNTLASRGRLRITRPCLNSTREYRYI